MQPQQILDYNLVPSARQATGVKKLCKVKKMQPVNSRMVKQAAISRAEIPQLAAQMVNIAQNSAILWDVFTCR
jgi:hypothetical protein